MALTDPQSVTVNGSAKSMPRIETSGRQSTYSKDDGTFKLKVSHQTKGGRIRSLARFDQVKVAVDPLTAENVSSSAGIWLVIDRPTIGYYSASDIDYMVQGFATWLSTAMVTSLVGQES